MGQSSGVAFVENWCLTVPRTLIPLMLQSFTIPTTVPPPVETSKERLCRRLQNESRVLNSLHM